MAKLGPPQIAQYARQAGFSGNSLALAVAIAMAESSGDTLATHVNTNGTVDYGLWQINSVHKQYNPSRLLNEPLYNAQAAYGISAQGRSFTPWVTYTTGAYLKYFTPGSALGNPSAGLGGGMPNFSVSPWWTYPRIDNLGSPDPYGGFPKPDSNIQIPANYPIHAILPGTVSGIDKQSSWGASVTIALDKPINSMATHTSYLHLACNIQVKVGQHISFGQVIAYNGASAACGAQKVPLGFALYNGPQYGAGPAWALMSKQNLTGNGPLNPVPLIESAKNGSLTSYGGSGNLFTNFFSSGSGNGNVPNYTPLLDQVHNTLVSVKGFYGIALAVDEAEQFPGWIDLTQQQPDVQIMGQDTGFSPPDIVGLSRSIGATMTDNFTPLTIRAGLVILGFVLLILLLAKLLTPAVKSIGAIATG